jgi:hypothetical protein
VHLSPGSPGLVIFRRIVRFSTDGLGLHLFGIARQSLFIALEQVAQAQGCVCIHIIARQAQLFRYA